MATTSALFEFPFFSFRGPLLQVDGPHTRLLPQASSWLKDATMTLPLADMNAFRQALEDAKSPETRRRVREGNRRYRGATVILQLAHAFPCDSLQVHLASFDSRPTLEQKLQLVRMRSGPPSHLGSPAAYFPHTITSL
jgi:hypothetical protein